MSRDQFWLTKAQFSKIKPHLPTDTRGKARVDDRRVISGIVQVLKSGARWVDAPPEYGPRKTLYNRYVRWAAKGVWVDLFRALAQAGGPPAQVLIDSSAVKAHRSAAGGKGGTKISPSAVRAAAARRKSTALMVGLAAICGSSSTRAENAFRKACKVGDAVSTLEAEGNANACRALAIQAKAENYQIGCQDAERKDAVILTTPIKLHEKSARVTSSTLVANIE